MDFDGSSPNNRIAYRIQSGATDKFVIDSSSGRIHVAQGASLDPDQSLPRRTAYQLHVVAVDGGIDGHQLHASAHVSIVVEDVNNKWPVLVVDPATIHVEENTPVGVVVTRLSASDADERSVLRYSIDHAASEGRTESGHLLRTEVYNVSTWLEINEDDGRIRLVRQLDRERAERIRLVVRVQDVAALPSHQTATGKFTRLISSTNSDMTYVTYITYITTFIAQILSKYH